MVREMRRENPAQKKHDHTAIDSGRERGSGERDYMWHKFDMMIYPCFVLRYSRSNELTVPLQCCEPGWVGGGLARLQGKVQDGSECLGKLPHSVPFL